MATYENILVEHPEGSPGVVLLTINRPAKIERYLDGDPTRDGSGA